MKLGSLFTAMYVDSCVDGRDLQIVPELGRCLNNNGFGAFLGMYIENQKPKLELRTENVWAL